MLGFLNTLSPMLIAVIVLLVAGVAVAAWAYLKWGSLWVRAQMKRRGYYPRSSSSSRSITALEAVAGIALTLCVVLPATSAGVHHIAVSNAVDGYREYLNGSMVAVRMDTIRCDRDGSCAYHYDCDPYDVQVPVTTVVSDGKGGTTTITTYVSETHYHSCPYVTKELNYWIEDSLGQHIVVMNNVFEASPREWRRGSGIPNDVQRGDPPAWTAAREAIERGDNPPTVKLHEYTNYLLAAQDSILQAHSSFIDGYRKKGLIPDNKQLATSVRGLSTTDKVIFVQMDPGSQRQLWQEAVNRLNSMLGTQLQGDLRVIVVPASKVGSGEAEQYTSALLANWQSRQIGKEGLAKNAILLVIGAGDDNKVAWSRAKTGIPEGNGAMLSALSNDLAGGSLDPRSLIGWPKASTNKDGKVSFAPSSGRVEQLVLRDYAFQRPCMMCKDATDHGNGYVFLKDSAMLPEWEKYLVVTLVTVFAILVFTGLAFIDLEASVKSGYAVTSGYVRNLWRNVRNRIGF